MKGKVKWFSAEKGYGFVHGEDGVDRFLHVKAVRGADLPAAGDAVEFEHKESERGPVASKVLIESSGPGNVNNSRVECGSCHKMMVPRVITARTEYNTNNQPFPKRSVCPFCAETYKEFHTQQEINQNLAGSLWFGFVLVLVLMFFGLGS
jgi:cold shock CspA family protein